jgi:hypothetical protein
MSNLDFARLLYNKGLYLQSLKILDRVKDMARSNNQVTYILQVLFLEKKIEALHITRSMQDRAERLSNEADEINARVTLIGSLSNLSLAAIQLVHQKRACKKCGRYCYRRCFFAHRSHPTGAGMQGVL